MERSPANFRLSADRGKQRLKMLNLADFYPLFGQLVINLATPAQKMVLIFTFTTKQAYVPQQDELVTGQPTQATI